MAYLLPFEIGEKEAVFMSKEQDIIAKIKNKLQYPKTALQLIAELKAGRRKNVPDEFIEDALRELDRAVKLLNKLAGWS